MHIHARAINYFDMIRRHGSIRGAARHLHVTASAVNRQLLQLEQEVGVPLFDRLPTGLKLTPAGEAFARHVINVLQDTQRLAGELDAIRGIRRGALSLIAANGLQATLIQSLVNRMLVAYPAIELAVRSGDSAAIADAVDSGEVDVGIGFSIPRRTTLRQAAVATFAFGAVVAPGHPLAGKPAVSFQECAAYPLILGMPELAAYEAMGPLLRNYKRPIRVALRTASIELMKGLAASGSAVAFLTRMGMEADLRQQRLVYVPLKGAPRMVSEVGVFVRAERFLPPAVDAFVRIAGEEIARQGAAE